MIEQVVHDENVPGRVRQVLLAPYYIIEPLEEPYELLAAPLACLLRGRARRGASDDLVNMLQVLIQPQLLSDLPQYLQGMGRQVAFLLVAVRFDELEGLEGDAGGRKLLPRRHQQIVEIEVEDPLELADVDTEDDLKRLERALSPSPES